MINVTNDWQVSLTAPVPANFDLDAHEELDERLSDTDALNFTLARNRDRLVLVLTIEKAESASAAIAQAEAIAAAVSIPAPVAVEAMTYDEAATY